MKKVGLILAIVLTSFSGSLSVATDSLSITWADLLPEERPYHDPFAELEYSQINDLARLFRIEAQAQDTINEEQLANAVEIRERLVSQGLDPDWLFEQRLIVMNQRRIEASEPNPDLIGKTIKMAGYLLPLDLVGEKAYEFLLVPTLGACIHTPPPPSNQMVLVQYSKGFEVDELYKPVWILGEMRAQNQSRALQLVDGQSNVETTYAMDALTVEVYK